MYKTKSLKEVLIIDIIEGVDNIEGGITAPFNALEYEVQYDILSDIIDSSNKCIANEMAKGGDIYLPHIGVLKIKEGTKLTVGYQNKVAANLGYDKWKDIPKDIREGYKKDIDVKVKEIRIAQIKQKVVNRKNKYKICDNLSELMKKIADKT